MGTTQSETPRRWQPDNYLQSKVLHGNHDDVDSYHNKCDNLPVGGAEILSGAHAGLVQWEGRSGNNDFLTVCFRHV